MFRFGVALLVLFRKEVPGPSHTTIRTATDWWNALRDWTHSDGTTNTTASAPRRRSPTNSNDSHSSGSRSSSSSSFDFELVVRKAYGVHGHYHSPVRHGHDGGGDEDEDGMNSRFQRGRTWRFPRRHILQRIIKMEEERVYDQIQIEQQQEQEIEQQYPPAAPTLSPTSSAAFLLPPPSQPLGLVTAGSSAAAVISERLDGEAVTSVITGRRGSGNGSGGRQSPDTTTHVHDSDGKRSNCFFGERTGVGVIIHGYYIHSLFLLAGSMHKIKF